MLAVELAVFEKPESVTSVISNEAYLSFLCALSLE